MSCPSYSPQVLSRVIFSFMQPKLTLNANMTAHAAKRTSQAKRRSMFSKMAWNAVWGKMKVKRRNKEESELSMPDLPSLNQVAEELQNDADRLKDDRDKDKLQEAIENDDYLSHIADDNADDVTGSGTVPKHQKLKRLPRLSSNEKEDAKGIQPDWAPKPGRTRSRGIVLGYAKRKSAKEHLDYFRGHSMGIAQISGDNLASDQDGWPAVNSIEEIDYLQAPSDLETASSSDVGSSQVLEEEQEEEKKC